jgi:hypothetical protein
MKWHYLYVLIFISDFFYYSNDDLSIIKYKIRDETSPLIYVSHNHKLSKLNNITFSLF